MLALQGKLLKISRNANRETRNPSALSLPYPAFRLLLEKQGPSLALWRAAEIASLRRLEFGRPILDLGCGDGLVASMVFSRVDVGIDPDARALRMASSLGIYSRLVAATGEKTGLDSGTVGTVLCNSVIEHLPSPSPVVAEAARILKPGGAFVITCPTEIFSSSLALPLGRYARWRNRRLVHLNLWPIGRWREEMERAGLAVDEVVCYLSSALVRLWDLLELLQLPRIRGRRLFGVCWRHLPPRVLDRMAKAACSLDLSSPPPGRGRMIVARKPGSS